MRKHATEKADIGGHAKRSPTDENFKHVHTLYVATETTKLLNS